MKSFSLAALLLAGANSVLAQDIYYNLVASAPGEDFDQAQLKANDRFWRIGLESNSTCGDISPAVTLSRGALAINNNGTSHQQYAFVDISGVADGLLAFTPANTPGGGPSGFDLRGAEQDQIYLYYSSNNQTASNAFLACESSEDDEYYVYPNASYAKSVGRDDCVEFQIRADEIDRPSETCTFF